MTRLPAAAEATPLNVPIVLSCLMVLAVALLPLLVAGHLVRPRKTARLYRALGSIALACLVLVAVAGGGLR